MPAMNNDAEEAFALPGLAWTLLSYTEEKVVKSEPSETEGSITGDEKYEPG